MSKKNLLIGMCRSVALSLYKKIVLAFSENYNVKVIFTSSAEKMFNELLYTSEVYDISIYSDDQEYNDYKKDNTVIHHIDLPKWADKFIICPATANTIAKINSGIADNLLTSSVLAWNKHLIIVPAINVEMWLNKITQKNIKLLEDDGNVFIYPTTKKLACGDFGVGAIADINTIASIVNGHGWYNPLKNPFLYIPTYPHLGAFGASRKHDIHTGVDLYCNAGDSVYAVESGIVKAKGVFTGKKNGTGWWNDTDYIIVSGKSGNVVYGEIEISSNWKIGDSVSMGG